MLKFRRRFGASTFYDTTLPNLSTSLESTSVTRKMQNLRASQCAAANYCSLSLDRRLYRKNSVTTRSGGRRYSQCSAASVASTSQSSWNDSWSAQNVKSVNQSESLSAGTKMSAGVRNLSDSDLDHGTSGSDQTSYNSRLDDDAWSGEQRFGDDVSILRHTGLSDNVNATMTGCSSTQVGTWSDFGHVGDGSKVEAARVSGGETDWRPQASVHLKRRISLRSTEASDRRAAWMMKRFRTTDPLSTHNPPSTQDPNKSVRVVNNEDDGLCCCKERSAAVTETAVNDDQLTSSLARSQTDSSAQTNSIGHNQNSVDGDETDFISSVELNTEMSSLTDDITAASGFQVPPSTSALSGSGESTECRHIDPPQRLSDDTVDNHCSDIDDGDNDDGGDVDDERASSSSRTLSTSLTELSMNCPVSDSLSDTHDTRMLSTATANSVGSSDRTVVSRVSATNHPRSYVGAAVVRCSVKPGGDSVRCSPGTLRTSYRMAREKSEASLVCLSGNVRYLRDWFERTASGCVTQSASLSSAVVDTIPPVAGCASRMEPASRGTDKRQRPGDGRMMARQSTPSRGHSASSDPRVGSSTSTLSTHLPDASKTTRCHPTLLPCTYFRYTKLNVDFNSLSDNDNEVGPEMLPLRL